MPPKTLQDIIEFGDNEQTAAAQVEQLNQLSTEKTLFFPLNSLSSAVDNSYHWVLLELDTETSHWTLYNTLPHETDKTNKHFVQTEKVVRFSQLNFQIKLVSNHI